MRRVVLEEVDGQPVAFTFVMDDADRALLEHALAEQRRVAGEVEQAVARHRASPVRSDLPSA